MPSNPEDVPPPPYTETDIFSTSGPAPSSGRRDSHTIDDQSTSSTNGDVIYTPPLTPRSSHLSNFAGEDDDHAANSSAATYFESRPAPFLSQPHIVHRITVAEGSTPGNLPYPSELAARDVRPEDWQTFANYLIPHYSAVSNEQVIDRKLRAEGVTSNSSNNNNSNNGNDDTSSQTSGRSHVAAQLDQIRCPVDHTDVDAARRRQNIEGTVREWNEGFFGPRHITIRVGGDDGSPPADELPQPQVHMPGAWDQSFDQQGSTYAAEPAPAASSRSRFGMFNPFGSSSGGGGGYGRGGRGGGGFRWGGITLDGERVTIGDSFVADGRTGSVRIGGIVADSNGISINGRSMFGGGFGPGRGMGRGGRGGCGYRSYPGGWPFGGGHCGGFNGRGRGHHTWGRGHSWWNPPRAQTAPQPGPSSVQQDGDLEADRGTPERGRGRWGHRHPHHHHGHQLSRSSSVSSTTSRSSSCSESTVGSLPDYDELRDSQLPVTKKYLQDWLHHPEHAITKETVKQIKGEIKQARNAAPSGNEHPDHVAALRREVKDLLREWKKLKKEQKRQRRQLRREKKRRRREEKRERRQVKREMRQAAREMRREQRHRHFSPFAAVPPIPPVPPVPPHGAFIPTPPPPPNPMFPFPGVTDFADPFRNHPWGWGHGAPPPPGETPASAWSAGNDHADNDTNAQGPSREKYKAASDLEAELMVKEAELFRLHEAIALEQTARESGGSGGRPPPYRDTDGDGDCEKKLSDKEREALAMQTEIEALAATMETLRTEADEEFARELAEEETRRARC
ncbi:hypothetical protein MMYC01_201129 [Madurella mycetomatis]|uniref:Uncharacterized protein n=1 Tax=Madurella mycetomatis TaxID=100816 RepID=A0A175WDV8_9PEZI|nr:hypothetical protein MMYC01_201129 [Madurella mycetomatis]